MEKLKFLDDNKSAEASKKKKKVLLKCHELGPAFDVWRVFPRVFILVYIVLILQVSTLVYEFGRSQIMHRQV